MYQKIAMASLTTALLLSCPYTGKHLHGVPGATTDAAGVAAVKGEEGDLFLLAGTYTSEKGSKGVYVYRFNTITGKSDFVTMAEVANPSYLTLSPDEKFVYTVGENDSGNSAAHAFSFDKHHGILTSVNTSMTLGSGPCYIAMHPEGKEVHTANYGDGSITSFQVNKDGSLTPATSVIQFEGSGPDSIRQKSPHLHSVMYSPDGRFLFASDLGTDKLYRFTVCDTPFDGQPLVQKNSLREFNMPSGTGPRHFDFHPEGGRYLYVLGELSGEVIVFDYSFGELTQKQVIAADTVGARGSADIHVSPNGHFLYASNRLRADGVAIFAIDPEEGTLTRVGYQPTVKHPRNFVITPNGKFLLVAGRDDDRIQVFSVDAETGLLTDIHQPIVLSRPVCLKFARMGE
ncbi:lactonase family protein [Proteiniphilum sp. UBA1028]|jgi:6-phosphogluconolactonase (cycloisomerase 2 family)|uniref:lactonase family protein n=1 Tax=Proteiniphilum sp. UBA1028 TaxID=1947251 RepID=UPI0025D39E6F|nr:lactonase family protein [Proteiniphilum sp. UBA1028]